MRYSTDQTMYDKFRHSWFNYLYDYGARCQFNQQIHRMRSEYVNQYPNLSIQKYIIPICKVFEISLSFHACFSYEVKSHATAVSTSTSIQFNQPISVRLLNKCTNKLTVGSIRSLKIVPQ
ncbi:unnamed protein product [Rotaria magnacalcarata]